MVLSLSGQLIPNYCHSFEFFPKHRSLMNKPFINPFQQTKFFTTVNHVKDLPAFPEAVEVAFVGRSNAGKSSALNTLCNRNRLAFVSKTPGRTQHINFFEIRENQFLVDLPGYGYASAPNDIRQHWHGLIGGYLQTREQLKALILIMDIRHPLKDLDMQLIEWFVPSNKPVHILLSKADKLARQHRLTTLHKVRDTLGKMPLQSSVQLFSSLNREGLEEAINTIEGLLKNKAPG